MFLCLKNEICKGSGIKKRSQDMFFKLFFFCLSTVFLEYLVIHKMLQKTQDGRKTVNTSIVHVYNEAMKKQHSEMQKHILCNWPIIIVLERV